MRYLIYILLFCLCFASARGQSVDYDYPSLSPLGTITQTIGNTDIYVEYERPSVRGRKIFGDLVPWNQVWRTGAGNATKIRFSKDVMVGGVHVKAGYYALLSIPTEESWTIILNSDTTLYGSYRYRQEDDIVRFSAPVKRTDRLYETLTVDIEFVPNNAVLYISWENTQTYFPIVTTTDEEVMKHITEELLSEKTFSVRDYANGASYLQYQDGDLEIALQLAEKALQTDSNAAFAHAVKIEILLKLGRMDAAKQAIAIAKEYTNNKTFENEEERQAELAYFDTLFETAKK